MGIQNQNRNCGNVRLWERKNVANELTSLFITLLHCHYTNRLSCHWHPSCPQTLARWHSTQIQHRRTLPCLKIIRWQHMDGERIHIRTTLRDSVAPIPKWCVMKAYLAVATGKSNGETLRLLEWLTREWVGPQIVCLGPMGSRGVWPATMKAIQPGTKMCQLIFQWRLPHQQHWGYFWIGRLVFSPSTVSPQIPWFLSTLSRRGLLSHSIRPLGFLAAMPLCLWHSPQPMLHVLIAPFCMTSSLLWCDNTCD